MAKGIGLVGWLVAGGIAALGISALSSPAKAAPKAPAWWPTGVAFPTTPPIGWPSNVPWPPDPNSPPPAGWLPQQVLPPQQTMPAPVPSAPAPCQLDANLPPDVANYVNQALSSPQQLDPSQYDQLIQLLAPYPMAVQCLQRRKNAGAPIQAA